MPITNTVQNIANTLSGQANRPDLEAIIESGFLDLCIEGMAAFAARGIDGLADAHHWSVFSFVSVINKVVKLPGCEVKIRAAARPLAFWLENDLAAISDLGQTTDSAVIRICERFCTRDKPRCRELLSSALYS